MGDRGSRARLSALIMVLAVLAWLPGIAAGWLFDPAIGGGPHLVYITERPEVSLPAEPHLPPLTLPHPPLEAEKVPTHLDLRGNEIVRPVAQYGVDHQGALYELHSPETEVPHLDPPEL